MRKILVTGGAGFIGSHFIRHILRRDPATEVINLDKLTYAGNLDSLREIEGDPRHRFVLGDICDGALVAQLMAGVDVVVNFASETHVDRSIEGADPFIYTAVFGTHVLLKAARDLGIGKMLQISTDEVYGDIPEGQKAKGEDPLRPRSPYAASKAGGDMQCLAFWNTYGTPVLIARSCNVLGPNQHLEKLIPLFTTNALEDKPLPLYGDGLQVRDWLYVEDLCRALELLLGVGEPGQVYNIGAGQEHPNIEVAEAIVDLLGKPRSLICPVADRLGHDRRYSMDWSKMADLGWVPRLDFATALRQTVLWYRDNPWWWHRVRDGQHFQAYYQQQYAWRLASPYAQPFLQTQPTRPSGPSQGA